jgi:hypothetical protein
MELGFELKKSIDLRNLSGKHIYYRINQRLKKFMQVLKTYYNRNSKVKEITLIWACTENGRK